MNQSLLASSRAELESSSARYGRRRMRLGPFSLTSLTSLFVLLAMCAQLSQAYPAAMIVFHHPYTSFAAADTAAETSSNAQNTGPTVSKRAFDRLDMSPFDFEALSKRYNDDDDYYRRKKAFDRLDENGFFGMLRKRRAFDQLDDNSFVFGRKRRSEGSEPGTREAGQMMLVKRPFDRLDHSAFGIAKKSQPGSKRMSIAQVLEHYPELFPVQSEVELGNETQ